MGARVRRFYPFLIVFGLELVFVLYLILSHRGVIGHDAFQYFGLQYFFLNNAANTGETAQWMPFITHGTVSNWWYGVQSGILQSAMLALGNLNKLLLGVNFLPIYYLGILFDLTLFLTGVCLLSRRYFNSRLTILFVAVLSLGSATWFTQPWYNLHFFFALPLIFHFIHALFDTGRWRYFLLAGNLFAVQSYGTLPYLLPVSTIAVCFYTLFYVVFWQGARAQIVRLVTVNLKYSVIPVVLVLLSLGVVYGMLTHGVDEIANYNLGRTTEGKSESEYAFLTYGTNANARWSELLARISPALDYSLYIGYAGLAFAALALVTRPSRALLAVACTALIILLIANSTPIAGWFFRYWPMMPYFRHVSLASTMVRMLLCFIAGFGFEALLVSVRSGSGRLDRIRYGAMMLLLACVSGSLLLLSHYPQISIMLLRNSHLGYLPLDLATFNAPAVQSALWTAAVWCAGTALLFAIGISRRIPRTWLAVAFIAWQTLDIYSFKYGLADVRTIPLTAEQYDLNRLQPVPYSPRRLPIDYSTHPRARLVPQNSYGAIYWTADTFTFTDPPSNLGRTDHWLWSLDDFLRAFWGEELRDRSRTPSFFRRWSQLQFPAHQPNALKLAGVTQDKIQFFSAAHPVTDDRRIGQLIAAPSFSGDLLYISAPDPQARQGIQPSASERVQRAYDLIQYDANNIRIRVPGANRGEWLYYADAWHPFWRAQVNGKNVPLYKANIAYKAVPLKAGENVVHLQLHSSVLGIYLQALNWNGLVWVIILGYLLYRSARRPSAMDADPRRPEPAYARPDPT
jgi:hypothetical protein